MISLKVWRTILWLGWWSHFIHTWYLLSKYLWSVGNRLGTGLCFFLCCVILTWLVAQKAWKYFLREIYIGNNVLFLALFANFLLFFCFLLGTLQFFGCFNFVFTLMSLKGKIRWSAERISDLTPRQQELFQELILPFSMGNPVSTPSS